MGKRGPKPKSQQDKALRGNPGKRALEPETQEVDVSSGTLRVSNKLTVDEKKIWRETIGAFPKWYFTAADQHLLTAYCRTVNRIDKSERALKNGSALDRRGNGAPCLSPHFRVISEGQKDLLRLSEILGMTREKRRVAGLGQELPPPAQRPEDPAGEEVEDIPDNLIKIRSRAPTG